MSKSLGSSGRRSAKDVRGTHQTLGKPVWTSSDSSRIISLSPISAPDFIFQDEFYVTGGVQDFDSISTRISVLGEVSTVPEMKGVFYGKAPSLLLVHSMLDLDKLFTAVEKIVRLLPTLGRLDVLLHKESTVIDPTEFLSAAMQMKDKFPIYPFQVRQMDRLIGSVPMAGMDIILAPFGGSRSGPGGGGGSFFVTCHKKHKGP